MSTARKNSKCAWSPGLAALVAIWPAFLSTSAAALAGGHETIAGQTQSTGSFQRTWKLAELLPPAGLDAVTTESFGGWSARNGSNVMRRVTKSQSGQNLALRGFHDRQGFVSDEDQALRLAALRDIKEPEFQEKRELSRYLLNQVGKAIGAHAQENSEFLRKLGEGLSFNIGTSKSSAKTSAANASLRYGLVLKEVKPSGKGIHVAALTMDEAYLDRALASKKKAQVDWTIGPLSETNNGSLFPELGNDTAPVDTVRAQGIFGIRPDLSLAGKVLPNFAPENGGQAGFKIRVEQPQGLYRMEMLTGSSKQVAHEFRLPVYGNLVLMRQTDSRLDATKSSVLNVFGFSDALSLRPVNLHYTHADNVLKAETGFDFAKGRLGVEANIAKAGERQAFAPRTCAVNFGRNF